MGHLLVHIPARPRLRIAACAFLFAVPLAGCAQERVSAPREDGQSTPLIVYRASGQSSACAPLAIISHGAGGSENGYRYLAEFMAHSGFTTIVMGHRESGFEALTADMRRDGILPGLRNLVADPNAESARLLDVTAALKWADSQCRAPFRVLLGHSMGAETVMLESGAQNVIHVASPPADRDRFDAYVAMSPEGPGIIFPDHAWGAIHKPVLVLTGTRDQSLEGGPEARQIPWRGMPGTAGHCQWLGVIDGASHMNFAGSGIGADKAEPVITQTIASFLSGVRAQSCTLPEPVPGLKLQAK
jgi:predicted dienelactone hydrolase